jgi:hypothetical protein
MIGRDTVSEEEYVGALRGRVWHIVKRRWNNFVITRCGLSEHEGYMMVPLENSRRRKICKKCKEGK